MNFGNRVTWSEDTPPEVKKLQNDIEEEVRENGGKSVYTTYGRAVREITVIDGKIRYYSCRIESLSGYKILTHAVFDEDGQICTLYSPRPRGDFMYNRQEDGTWKLTNFTNF